MPIYPVPISLPLALCAALLPSLAWAEGAPPPAPGGGSVLQATAATRDAARALAAQGMKLYEAGQYAASIEWFRKADALYPAPQYRIYTARALAKTGELRKAAASYAEALAVPLPAPLPASFREARKTASAELAELHGRIPTIQIQISGAPANVVVTIDGAPVSPADWDHLEVDPGKHVVVADAPGYHGDSKPAEAAEGTQVNVSLVLLPVPAPPAPPPVLAPVLPPVFAPALTIPERDTRPRAPLLSLSLSHRRQFGAMARADVDPLHSGARAAVGLTFGLMDHLELGASALLGRTMGVEPQATVFVLNGAFKPLINVGAPIFFADGPRPGLRGAAGLQWDPLRRFGVFMQVGGGYFPAPGPGYEKSMLLLAAGVQGRI